MADSGAPKFWPFEVVEPGDFKWPERKIEHVKVYFINDEAAKQSLAELVNEKHMLEGWQGIGFHYVIDKEGNICTGRPLSEISIVGEKSQLAHTIAIGCSQSDAARTTAIKLCEQILEVSRLARKKITVTYE